MNARRVTLPAILADLLAAQGGRCALCQQVIEDPVAEANIDHIVPRAAGGLNRLENYQATHAECNRIKGSGGSPQSCLACRRVLASAALLATHWRRHHAPAPQPRRALDAYDPKGPVVAPRALSKAAWRGGGRRR